MHKHRGSDLWILPDGETPFILKRKVIGALFLRDRSPTVLLCQEIHLEFSMSCLRGVATPDPWNTSNIAVIIRLSSKGEGNGLG